MHLCGDCDLLPEAECTPENGCHKEFGSPLIEQDGVACFDAENQQYVGCLGGNLCNDASIVICLEGQPDRPFKLSTDCGLTGTGPCNDFPGDDWVCS